MFIILLSALAMIIIFIYEWSNLKTNQKTKSFYVLRRPDWKYVVATTNNPDERECEFLVLRYDGRIEVTFAAFASECTELETAKQFGQRYLDQNPRRFTPVSI